MAFIRWLLLLLLISSACGPTLPPPRPLASLRIRCEPEDASIYVDDRLIGTISGLRQQILQLPEGFHRIELRRDGYFSHFAEVHLTRGDRRPLQAKLRKEPF